MKLKEGQVYKRIKGPNVTFTEGNHYPVKIDENNVPFILSDRGARWYSREIMDECFELVQDEKEDMNMEYKFKEGQVYEYTGNSDVQFDKGQLLKVQTSGTYGYVLSKTGEGWFEDNFTAGDLKLLTAPDPQATKHEEEGNMVNPDSTFTPKPVLINAETLLKNIAMNKRTSGEIMAYLEGYVKGARY